MLQYLCQPRTDSSTVSFCWRLLSISSKGVDFMIEDTYNDVVVCNPDTYILSFAGIADLLDGESTRILRSVW